MICRRLCNELVTKLRIEAGNPGSQFCTRYTSAACSASVTAAFSHTGHSGTQLDFDVAKGHIALVSLHSGNLPSATLQEPHAGNYETDVASVPTSVLHASVISLHLYARNSAGICFLQTKEKEE